MFGSHTTDTADSYFDILVQWNVSEKGFEHELLEIECFEAKCGMRDVEGGKEQSSYCVKEHLCEEYQLVFNEIVKTLTDQEGVVQVVGKATVKYTRDYWGEYDSELEFEIIDYYQLKNPNDFLEQLSDKVIQYEVQPS